MKRLTNREKVLMAILGVMLVGVVYYMLFYTPTMEELSSLDSEISSIQDEILITKTQTAKLANMQAELDEIQAEGTVAKLAAYDNSAAVMNELNNVLLAADTYSLSFAAVDNAEQVVRRNVSIEYTTGSYSAARAVFDALHDGQFRCQISDLTITLGDSYYSYWTDASYRDTTVTVNLTITYYEYQNNYQSTQPQS